MPYTISEAANAMQIAERQWGTGAEIRFTAMTSCIAVIGVVDGAAWGVHLSVQDAQENPFSQKVAKQVGATLQDSNTLWIIGAVNMWSSGSAPYNQSYKLMIEWLKNPPPGAYLEKEDGVYGATYANNTLRVTGPFT